MQRVRAVLRLDTGEGKRQRPVIDGYRPLFAVTSDERTSGAISLRAGTEVAPGETGTVEITFDGDHTLRAGMRLPFFEGIEPLGEVEILEVLDDV